MQIDLFGGEVAKPTVRKKVAEREPKAAKKIAFDRKALWSRSGYLPGSREIDEEESALAGSTSDTRSDNATIERLEAALGLKPVVRNGQWVCNELEYQYRRVGKPFKGAKKIGPRGSMLGDLNKQLTLQTAREAIEPLFTDPCSWLVINSVAVLEVRLRMMDPDEDHHACLAAFLQVMAQHDFIDNTRRGETIRSLTKRDQMREKRAAARQKREQKAVEALMDAFEQDDTMEQDDSFDSLETY